MAYSQFLILIKTNDILIEKHQNVCSLQTKSSFEALAYLAFSSPSSLNNSYPTVLTYSEAVVSTITAVVQTAVCLVQEEAAGTVVIVGGDTRHPQTFPLSQQLLLPGEAPVVRAGLRSGVTMLRSMSKRVSFRSWKTKKQNGQTKLSFSIRETTSM